MESYPWTYRIRYAPECLPGLGYGPRIPAQLELRSLFGDKEVRIAETSSLLSTQVLVIMFSTPQAVGAQAKCCTDAESLGPFHQDLGPAN
jgi:hypothetical protein